MNSVTAGAGEAEPLSGELVHAQSSSVQFTSILASWQRVEGGLQRDPTANSDPSQIRRSPHFLSGVAPQSTKNRLAFAVRIDT